MVCASAVDLSVGIKKLSDRPRTGFWARKKHESVSVGDAHEANPGSKSEDEQDDSPAKAEGTGLGFAGIDGLSAGSERAGVPNHELPRDANTASAEIGAICRTLPDFMTLSTKSELIRSRIESRRSMTMSVKVGVRNQLA